MEIIIAIPFVIITIIAWRITAGNVAWRIHTTAETKSDCKPAVEDWVMGTVIGAPLALFWPLFIVFKLVPNSWLTQDEQEAVQMSKDIQFHKMQLMNERRYKELVERSDEPSR